MTSSLTWLDHSDKERAAFSMPSTLQGVHGEAQPATSQPGRDAAQSGTLTGKGGGTPLLACDMPRVS